MTTQLKKQIKKGKVTCIKNYFGKGESLSTFKDQLTKLTNNDKLELAQGAAKELGYSQKDVDFPLL